MLAFPGGATPIHYAMADGSVHAVTVDDLDQLSKMITRNGDDARITPEMKLLRAKEGAEDGGAPSK